MSISRLSWDKLLSAQRPHAPSYADENGFDARNEFQRDVDRIVFSSAFRRLQDKTQVMPLPTSDFVRSRLTHSVEVASVGRSLGKLAGTFIIQKEGLTKIQPDDFGTVISAACLAHDIGNPPFGHTGEKAIGKFFKSYFEDSKNLENKIIGPLIASLTEAQKFDLIKFEGNAAGFRILTNDHSSGVKGGLRTTYATLGVFSKYPRPSVLEEMNTLGKSISGRQSHSKFGFFQEEVNQFREVAEHLGLIELTDSGSVQPSWCRHPLSFLLEAADSITYSIIDFEDGHKLNYINSEEAIALLFAIIENSKDPRCDIHDWKKIEDKDEQIGALRSKVINALLFECLITFEANYEEIMTGEFDIELSQEIHSKDLLKQIKRMSFSKYFSNSNVIDIELAGYEILGGLLSLFVNSIADIEDSLNQRLLLKMPEQIQATIKNPTIPYYKKLLVCTDFVSRMTDGYAMKLYKKLKGIEI